MTTKQGGGRGEAQQAEHPPRLNLIVYSRFNLQISSLRKCYEVEKRSGMYMDVHEHRIAEIVTFAALEIFKGE
jgi:hypothetical protein